MRSRLARFFSKTKADALLLANGDAAQAMDPNFFYFTGLGLDSALMLARRSGQCTILCSPLNYGLAREMLGGRPGMHVKLYAKGKDVMSLLAGGLKGARALGVHKRHMTANAYERTKELKKKLLDVSDELEQTRMVKDGKEISAIRRAARLSIELVEGAEIKAGMSELELEKQLHIATIEAGAQLAFPTIALSGPNTRFPHGQPTKRKIRANEAVLIDFGVKVGGYCSDITRCFFTGSCKNERAAYEKIISIHDELIDYGKAGMKISDFAARVEFLFKKYRLPPLPHAIGHGIGLEVHEAPHLSRQSRQKFQKGMVVAIEPALYLRKFGLRYENDAVVSASGSLRNL